VPGAVPAAGIDVADPDSAWPRRYEELAGRIREALGWRVLQLEHVGSTSVPGLAAKPVTGIDLTVADPGREQDYVPALETACNLHVFGPTALSWCTTGSSVTGCGATPPSATATPPSSGMPRRRPAHAEST